MISPRGFEPSTLAAYGSDERGILEASHQAAQQGGPGKLVACATIGAKLRFEAIKGEKMSREPLAQIDRLRELVQEFVRRFGLLVTKETPCGQPISLSYAHALMVLLERTRAPATSQTELGLALGIDKSNVTRLCSRMEAAGHVSQVRAPGDRRSRLVILTPAGRRLAQRIEEASRRRFGRIVAAVSPDQRRTVFESLALLNAAVESLRTETP